MSSEVELVPGGVTGDVTGSELAEVCQQSHVSVTGHNNTAYYSPLVLAAGDDKLSMNVNGLSHDGHVILGSA